MLHSFDRERAPSPTNVRKNDRVSHTRFGPGVVIDADARYTIIEFDEAGVRKFVSTLVRLERCELPVPVKPAPVRRRRRTTAAAAE
jgi:hypothetical protein